MVIDGFVTDVGAIRAAGLPVWCQGHSPLTTKIRCGGAVVRPGDLVLADENGVLILDPNGADPVARRALAM